MYGCDCVEYSYDVSKGIRMRAERQHEKILDGVQATWEWAAQSSNERRGVRQTTWDEAAAQMDEAAAKAGKPLRFPDQPGMTRKRDPTVLDAVRELGGSSGDLTG